MEERLDSINDNIIELSTKTKEMAEESKSNCDKAVNALNRQKKNLYETTFTTFSVTAGKIKNIDFDNTIPKENKLNTLDTAGIENYSLFYFDHSTGSVIFDGIATFASSVLDHYTTFPPDALGAFELIDDIAKFVRRRKLSSMIEEANAEYSKLKAQCELVKKECSKIDSVTKLCGTTHDTIAALKKMADMAIGEMQRNIAQYGVDYGSYPNEVQTQVYFTFNLIGTLNALANKKLITGNGNVSAAFRKFVGEVNQTYLLNDGKKTDTAEQRDTTKD